MKRLKEMWVKFSDGLYRYFALPLVVVLFVSFFSKLFEGRFIGSVFGLVSIALFLIWLVMVIYKLCAKKYGPKTIRWILVVAIVPFILSIILSLFQHPEESNYCFVIGAIFFELYAIGYIIYSIINQVDKITNIILMSFIFVLLGYGTIYFSTYGFEENTLFNSLISMFSAIIGGSLTLGGVAWTIKHERKLREKNERFAKLQTCPVVYFETIDKVVKDISNASINGSNVLKLVSEEITKGESLIIRFVFGNNSKSPLKIINIKSIHLYTNHINQENMGDEWLFVNTQQENYLCNVSAIKDGFYQAVSHLVANKEDIDKLFDKLDKGDVFLCVQYVVINVNNVCCSNQLNFNCNFQKTERECILKDIQNVSNWSLGDVQIIDV